MGDHEASLMLRIRADALKTNLDRVKDFLQRAPSRRTEIETLENQLKEIYETVKKIDNSVYGVKGDIADEFATETPATFNDLQRRVGDLQVKLGGIVGQIGEIQKSTLTARTSVQALLMGIAEMKHNCFRIEPKEPVGQVLTGDLKSRIDAPTVALAGIQKALGNGPATAGIWQDYGDANLKSQDIFAEYVDFLGGMALRDIGFDEGISRTAEDLIRTYTTNQPPQYPWLALPGARREALARTLARIVRVGFPEWTIWALPFTAHAFWQVIARYDFATDLKLDGQPVPERFQSCLGDAFATYNMGPAYAYAAFYLLLSPLEAYAQAGADTAGDDSRARAILEMLVAMSSGETEGDLPGYAGVADSLKTMWTAALTQAGAGAATPATENDNQAIPKLVASLLGLLGECECSSFTSAQWDQVEVPEQLKADRPLQVGELRSVLNGMWKARVDPAAKDIKDLAAKVRDRIMKKKTLLGAATSPNVPTKVTAP
jgi:hypothetical protein